MLLIAAPDVITATDGLEFPTEMRPAFDVYMECLNSNFGKQISEIDTLPPNFDAVASGVINGCKPVRARAFAQAQEELAIDPVPSTDNHAGLINATFNGLESSFSKFTQTMHTSLKTRRAK